MKFSTKLIITVIAVAFIVVPLCSIGFFLYTRSILQRSIVDNQLEFAIHTIDEIDRMLYRAYQEVQLIAENAIFEETFEQGESPKQEALERIKQEVEELSILTGPWDALMVVNKSGVIVDSLNKKNIGKNIRDYSNSRLAFYSALKGEAHYSDLVISDVTGRATVIFYASIENDATYQINGLVIGHFAWPVVEELLDDISNRWHMHLLDKDGVLIGGQAVCGTKIFEASLAINNLVKKSLTGNQIGPEVIKTMVEDGITVNAVYVLEDGFLSFRGNNWGLLMEAPVTAAFAPIRQMAVNISIIAIIVMTILTWGLYLVGKTLTDPIDDLSKTVKIVGSGDLSARIKERTKDEIGLLATTFNMMAENLQKTTVSRDYVDNIIRNITDILIVIDSGAKIKIVNQTGLNLLGYREDELIDKSISMIIAEEEKELRKMAWIKDLIKKEFISGAEKTYLSKDGHKMPVLFSGAVMHDDNGVIQGIVCVAQDITDRKRLKELLVSEKERLSVTLHSIGDGVVATDNKCNVVVLNRVAQELTGRSQEEALGSPLSEVFRIINEKTREPAENPVEKVLEKGVIIGIGNDTVLIAKDGKEMIIEDSAAPIFDNDGNIIGVVLVFRDMTERKQFEKDKQDMQVKMLTTSKLSSLGEVATGVAHEVNQPLTYISCFIQGLKLELKEETIDMDHLKEGAEVSLKQINRINNIIQHLRTFGRREDVLNKQISIKTVLDNTLLLMGERIRLRNIELIKNIEADLSMVSGNSNQLEQIFINLFQNSIDALENKSEDSRICVDIFLSENNESVIIKVKDNGKGIGSGALAKIFEPFFTTKEVGKGTGLGLSIIYGIVREHNGAISCESEINKGTTFTIMLPANGRN